MDRVLIQVHDLGNDLPKPFWRIASIIRHEDFMTEKLGMGGSSTRVAGLFHMIFIYKILWAIMGAYVELC